MSFCSHQLLDYDPSINLYRCRDCPNHFEARMIGTGWNGDQEKDKPSRVLPMFGIAAGLLFALAVLVVVYKLQIKPSEPLPREVACQDTKEWRKRADEANRGLKECLSRPPKIEIVEVPIESDKECPLPPECPQIDTPECRKSYKVEFQQCMEDRGGVLYDLEQCEKRGGKLSGCNRKIEELRAIISRLTLNQGGKCPDVDVTYPNRGCEKEIEAACGNLREALQFYFEKSKSQPGEEKEDGFSAMIPPMWKPGPLIESDIEWDD